MSPPPVELSLVLGVGMLQGPGAGALGGVSACGGVILSEPALRAS